MMMKIIFLKKEKGSNNCDDVIFPTKTNNNTHITHSIPHATLVRQQMTDMR